MSKWNFKDREKWVEMQREMIRAQECANLCTDYIGKCGNCHEPLGDDEYCRYCGTKKGDGEFKPYQNVSYCIYGPAPKPRVHTCNVCKYKWTTYSIAANEKYCPKCGNVCEIEIKIEKERSIDRSIALETKKIRDALEKQKNEFKAKLEEGGK